MTKAALIFVGASTASGLKCVFVHGTGCTQTSAPTSTDTADYWGGKEIEKFTPFCSSRVFVHEDTVNRGWDDEEMQKTVCAAATGGSSSIDDSIVFTHSMGNLVLAAGLKNGFCTLGDTSHWYSANAPWMGSAAAAWVSNLCSNRSSYPEALQWLAHELKYCDPKRPGFTTQSYVTMSPSYPGLSELRAYASQKVSGAMCGYSGLGLVSKWEVPLEALSKLVPYHEDNDGMVGISSCKLPSKTYEKTYTSPFYLAHINHGDGTCVNGNGDFGYASRQPCSWYAHAHAVLNASEAATAVIV